MNITVYSKVHAVMLYTRTNIEIYCNDTEKVCELYISDTSASHKIISMIQNQKVCSMYDITEPVTGIVIDFKTVRLTCKQVDPGIFTQTRYTVIGVVYK